MTPEAEVWFKLAEDDYKNARLMWVNRRYGATVSFYQQAVEKIAKAYLVEKNNVAPPKTHRIEVLLDEAKLHLEEIDSPDVSELSKAYIRVRYPDISKQYYRRRDRVEPIVLMSRKVYLWIKNKFKIA